jgi:hypothetical protein
MAPSRHPKQTRYSVPGNDRSQVLKKENSMAAATSTTTSTTTPAISDNFKVTPGGGTPRQTCGSSQQTKQQPTNNRVGTSAESSDPFCRYPNGSATQQARSLTKKSVAAPVGIATLLTLFSDAQLGDNRYIVFRSLSFEIIQ